MRLISNDIIEQYGLNEKVLNDFAYIEIRNGIYGLPQAGILSNKLLKERLARHGYFEQPHTPGLWKHLSRPIWFNLCVDDFGVKYIGDDNLKHLFAALHNKTYNIVEDWSGNLYCGISLVWNYNRHYVDISMPAYAAKDLSTSSKAPALPIQPQSYLVWQRQSSSSTNRHKSQTQRSRQEAHPKNVGSFLYYARAIDPRILMVLSAIAAQQSAPTEQTRNRVN